MTTKQDLPGLTRQIIASNGIDIHVVTMGNGPAILLLHGWPHTWEIWRTVMPLLAADHTVIAPDLRGLGGTTRAAEGYDLHTLADDANGVLDGLGIETATVVGIDLGVQISAMMALRFPERVRHLIVTEGLIGTLPGAEGFLARGAPWWFGFHGVPGLAESVLDGNTAAYLDFFLINGTADRRGIDPVIRDGFISAYADRTSLRCGFEHYRAFPTGARQLAEAVAVQRIAAPTLAIAGGIVGTATAGQLRPICEDLQEIAIPGCAHLVPLEQPITLAAAIGAFVA
ncbi:alpha/beta fold hydrolase [Gluconacetobacter tumulicola]|uniref:Alpha/beta hydrolase n=1 Tax=Gluconacetobacter tumulicola TaxID=1017177 RepID=A0A7W4JGX0_9PROT|nr:alpha/beta hydrolase [Gluconacetobacter tumulicola]MBB2181042.1 alpha/beta hydrolase [Gluconacetobacter tumulicola]